MNRFRVRWEQHDYRAIYGMTDTQFRDKTSIAEMESALVRLADELGQLTRTREIQRSVNWVGADAYITFVMDSQFEKTTAVETFSWRVTPSNIAYLLGYRVDVGGVKLIG